MIARCELAFCALIVACALVIGCSGGGSSEGGNSGGGGSNGGGGGGGGTPPPGLVITTTSLPNVIQGQQYSQTLQASGGTPPYKWTSNTPLLAGMALSSNGILSGAPQTVTASNNYGIQFQVTDSGSPAQLTTSTIRFIVIAPLTIPTLNLSSGDIGIAYSGAFLSATGGLGTYTWGLQSGSMPLPLGITLSSSDGTLSGLPVSSGTYNFTVQVSDVGPPQQVAVQTFSLTIQNHVHIVSSALPPGVIGKPYSGALKAIGATPPYSWSMIQDGALPTGLHLDGGTGNVTGVPTQTFAFDSGFTVTDSSTPSETDSTFLPVPINPALGFAQPSLPDGILTQGYGYAPVLGGIGPYAVQITAGSLPSGLSLAASGTGTVSIAGTPLALGSSNFTLQAEDSELPPVTVQQSFTLRVNPLLAVQGTPPPGAVGIPYSFQFQGGGLPPLHWTFPGSLFGLMADATTGLISGTPRNSGSMGMLVAVTDSSNPPQRATMLVVGFTMYDRLKIATSSLPSIALGSPVSVQLKASGGSGNYSWSIPSGTWPSGLALSSSGMISGEMSQAGAFSLPVQVSDSGPPTQAANQMLPLTLGASLGRNDSIAMATPLSNGTYVASISPVADPPTGVAAPDTDYYQLTADPGAMVSVKIFAQRLTPPSPLDSVLELVDAAGNQLMLCSSDSGNTAGPFTQVCLNDDLVQGVSTDSELLMQVPATDTAALRFYAHVLDFRGNARPDMIYQIQVDSILQPQNILPAYLGPGATSGVIYSQQFTTTGGTGHVTWSISSGTLPPGWSLSPLGLLSGVATTDGVYSFTVMATDTANPPDMTTMPFTLTIAEPLIITSPAVWPVACFGQPYSFTMQTAGGLSPITWGYSSGSWPAGIQAQANMMGPTLTFAGVGNVVGTFTAIVGAGDSAQPMSGQSQKITLTIANCP